MILHRHEEGSVTVEAAVALPIFMFAIITILSLVNVCMAQARITAAVNSTAKEISQYSYMYALTGFKETHESWANGGNSTAGQVNKVVKTANDVFNAIEGLAETNLQGADNTDALLQQMQGLIGDPQALASNASQIASIVKGWAKNPRDLIFGMVKLVASNALDAGVSHFIAAPLSKHMCEKHLVNEENGDIEQYLKALQIVPDEVTGLYLDGLDFSQSTLFAGGDDRIVITCKYKIKMLQLLPIDIELTFRSTAITKIWPADQTLGQIFGK